MRPNLFLVAGFAGLFSAAALVASSKIQDTPKDAFSLAPVAGGVGVIVNPNGGNVAVLSNAGGSLVVDTNLENFRDQYQKAFDAFAGDNTRFVVNTHWHGDHTGNNVLLGSKGVPVVAHEGVRARLAGGPEVEGRKGENTPSAAMPTVTFDDDLELYVGDERIVVRNYGAGHTDGDGVVWFYGSKVVHMGDLFFNGLFPFIDLTSGGNVRGFVAAVGSVAEGLEAEADVRGWKIVPGHGPVCGLADLKAYHAMLVDSVQRVERALADGMTMEELVASDLLAEYEGWSWGFISTERFLQTLGGDLAKK